MKVKAHNSIPSQAEMIAGIIWQPTPAGGLPGVMQPGGGAFPPMGFVGLPPALMEPGAAARLWANISLIAGRMTEAR